MCMSECVCTRELLCVLLFELMGLILAQWLWELVASLYVKRTEAQSA